VLLAEFAGRGVKAGFFISVMFSVFYHRIFKMDLPKRWLKILKIYRLYQAFGLPTVIEAVRTFIFRAVKRPQGQLDWVLID